MTDVVLDSQRPPAAVQTLLPVDLDILDGELPGEVNRPARETWRRQHVATLLVADALCATAAIAVGWVLRLGNLNGPQLPLYLLISVAVVGGWSLSLNSAGAYDLRRVTSSTQEVRRVMHGGFILAASVAIIAYVTQVLVARTFVAIVIPIGVVLQLMLRYVVRRSVNRRRARGEWTNTILAVGNSESTRHLIDATRRNPAAGLRVIAACVEDAERNEELSPGVPVLGDTSEAAAVAERVGADIVAIAGAGFGPRRVRELGWELEGTGRNMVMAPGLSEVAGPRIHVSPVEGLPLVWVDEPQFTGAGRLVKRALDITGSGILLLLGLPFLLLVGLAVRLTSRGPALYRSARIGTNGRLFTVYKFRSMHANADSRKDDLLELNESVGAMLFKIKKDPRVTPVGRVLRKFSIDELPQLLNVLGGSMSLVGPRPPLPDEVARYTAHTHRRMLVKPGMTGLWQVSGRSDLSWDEAVRLDLFYVENWTLGLDLAIILRTAWAVVRSRGAY